ncbi:ATP-dependent helicase/nuclease subunit A [Ancylobacter sp. 3268]|uniref:double-strand break repair helicase AddA n=1 Tax=Ancylobacter sp. 3268 TaxID=2817752 RepID=UPI00285A4B9C|nr:double-strand break repair helicase AddA [Ancylobacter sp. 3268]MDR6954021.1 ATP-dependent helicase/nuclease subunit A [Ancylobacter sp. 3268]
MSEAPLSSAALGAATALQTRASDPGLSVWVSANAGAGKTHVLARRVIRLLLRGVPPGRILCLTYTKAAAANMANRVLAILRDWAVVGDADLDKAIGAIDAGGSASLRARARSLFALALETPGGLKIQTIHAFCGHLLRAFPFEAGVPAGFRSLEDAQRLELLALVRARIVQQAAGAPDTPLGRAFALIIGEVADSGLDELLAALLDAPDALDAGEADLARLAGLDPVEPSAAIARRIVDEALIPRGAWRGMGEALIAAGGNAARRGADLLAAAQAAEDEVVDAYAGVFLKADGGAYADKFLGSGEVRAAFPALAAERDRLAALGPRLAAARVVEKSLAALELGRAARRLYEAEKAARGMLDFADLVSSARRLLGSGASAWVHYKLDRGIDHVLLDEAQDTSPEQWEVIQPLVMEFFAGEGAREEAAGAPRTLFVVGDEKQSIFSFQGADPSRFDAMRAEFARHAPEQAFAHVKLQHSFRSAPGILAAVDEVFSREEAYRGLTASAERTVHVPIHAQLPARVEIWEPEAPVEQPEPDAWQRPLDAPRHDDPVSRLADKIASHIKALIDGGAPVEDRGGPRAARAGDFLVLVRRRSALFEAVIRALKQVGVAVAGADRLVVAEHIAVMDLAALGEALLSPDDELSLASALKSPLFGFDDDDLIALLPKREARLIDELTRRAGERPHWRAAVERLDRLRPEAASLRPFDFYARVLGRERGRALMLARLGPEAADALDEMLAIARAYESTEAPSLAGFLAFLRGGQAQAKRDMEAGRDQVRVMTVHGAKGLEAPYVLLADTTSGPQKGTRGGLLAGRRADGGRAFLVAARKAEDTPAMGLLRLEAEAALMDEYRRLLYVALTRAECALVLCGADGKRKRPSDCWYDVVRSALEGQATAVPAIGFAGTVLRWRATPEPERAAAARAAVPVSDAGADAALARRLARPVALAAANPRLRPSQSSSIATPEQARTAARGALLHRLFAALAALPEAQRRTAGGRVLALAGVPDGEALLDEALATLALPELAVLFAPDGRAEVDIAGALADGTLVSGRIDRLVVLPERVIVADFKTDRRVPSDLSTAPRAHVEQIALYARLLARLYPGHRIEPLIVYTAGPRVLALAGERLWTPGEDVTSE